MSSFSDKFKKISSSLGKQAETKLNEQKDQLIEIEKEFKHNKSVFQFQNLYFNDDRNQLYIAKGIMSMIGKPRLFEYHDITGFKPLIDGKEVKKHHRFTRAIVGGVLLAGAGAVIGAFTGGKEFSEIKKMIVVIYFRDNTNYSVDLINGKTIKRDSALYEKAEKDLSDLTNKLQRIIDENKIVPSENPDTEKGVGDIRELKGLLDDGIITQEEFDAKKNQILGL